MNSCVIIGGANIENYDYVRSYISREDYIICCDSGLAHCEKLSVAPDLIVGDFDSYEKPQSDIETIVLPCEKDDTDTMYGVREAIKRGYNRIILLGVVGNRLDHSLGNVYILYMLEELGIEGIIVDDYSYMKVISDKPEYIQDTCRYFSLINMSKTAKGVTIENAKYNLDKADIEYTYQYAISNEVIPGKKARVSIEEGKLLLIVINA